MFMEVLSCMQQPLQHATLTPSYKRRKKFCYSPLEISGRFFPSISRHISSFYFFFQGKVHPQEFFFFARMKRGSLLLPPSFCSRVGSFFGSLGSNSPFLFGFHRSGKSRQKHLGKSRDISAEVATIPVAFQVAECEEEEEEEEEEGKFNGA